MSFDDLKFYEGLGLKCGLEVHQQVLTRGKMFCRCPAYKYSKEHDGVVLRHMRPTLSEMGTYDGTALMEFKTRKEIIYLLNDESVCTYEMDDTPPFLLDEEALDNAIVICKTLGCPIVDEVHIARKQYLDGSIPTGFQRTGIVGLRSKIPFRGRHVGVLQVSLEEDSCREVSDKGHKITFRTDRLGMPLIEVVTDPDFKTPMEIAEGARLIGRILRSTGLVRRGLGATRQDVNVSVRGGVRCEIKGVNRYQYIPALVHNEALRQAGLLKVRDELLNRGFKEPSRVTVIEKDVTGLFKNSSIVEPAAATKKGDKVRAVLLKGMAGVLSMPTQPGIDFSHELKGRVRVVACLDESPYIYDSEHWPEGAAQEISGLRTFMEAGEKDALVIIWGTRRDTETGVAEIKLRLEDAVIGVPNETRMALSDGHTDFERILPGPDRMYPDTDHPVIALPKERVERLSKLIPVMPWVREEKWKSYGLSIEAAERIAISPYAEILEEVVEKNGVDPVRAGFLVAHTMRRFRRSGIPAEEMHAGELRDFLVAVNEAGLEKEGWNYWFRKYVTALPGAARRDVLAVMKALPPIGDAEAAEIVEQAVKEPFTAKKRGSRLDWCIGKAMERLRGRYAASKVVELVKAGLERIGA